MYEFARAIHHDRVREAEQRRMASSLPKCRSWELGGYKITVQRPGRSLPNLDLTSAR